MSATRTPRPVRTLRWARALGHLGNAWLILRFTYPRSTPEERRELYRQWSSDLLRMLAVDLVVRGTPPAEGTGVLIAANHVSWLDILAISSVRATRFIAKSEIRDWPVVGWICERAGTLFVRRTRRHDTGRINALVHEAIAEGDCVGLFPEGTTTEGGQLLKFHSSLFEPAVANEAVVVPAAIAYALPDGTPCRAAAFAGELTFAQSMGLIIRQRKIVATLSFGEPIATAGAHRREVALAARAQVATLLDLPNPDSPPRTPPDPAGAPR